MMAQDDLDQTILRILQGNGKISIEEIAEEVRDLLIKKGFWILYDNGGSIGRRYARVDEIGVPLAVAIDYETKDKEILTIRNRDTWEQVSLSLAELPATLQEYFSGEKEFNELGVKYEKEEA